MRCGNDIPSGLQGKHKQAMYAKNREWYSGSSSSSGLEEWKAQEQQGAGKSPEEPGEPASGGSGLEEACRMEFEQETEYKKKMDEQKKSLQRHLRGRKSCRVCGISRGTTSRRLEIVKKKCKRSIKSGRKRKHFTRRDSELCLKGRVTLGKRQQSWKMRSITCTQVKKEEAAVRRNPMDAALNWPFWSNSSRWEQPRQCSSSPIFMEKTAEKKGGRHGPEPTAPERAGAEEMEAWEEEWDVDERMANGWYESAAFGSVVDPAEGSRKSQHSKKWNTRS